MSTENATPGTTVRQDVSATPSIAVRQDVSAALAGSGIKVRGLVIDQLTQAEIAKRTTAVITVLGKIDAKHSELQKQQNQGTKVYTIDNTLIGEPSFTRPQLEEMKKLRDSIGKMQHALEVAFGDKNDFSDVYNIANQKDNPSAQG